MADLLGKYEELMLDLTKIFFLSSCYAVYDHYKQLNRQHIEKGGIFIGEMFF